MRLQFPSRRIRHKPSEYLNLPFIARADVSAKTHRKRCSALVTDKRLRPREPFYWGRTSQAGVKPTFPPGAEADGNTTRPTSKIFWSLGCFESSARSTSARRRTSKPNHSFAASGL